MNTLEIKRTFKREPLEYDEVSVMIDGRDLIAMVREVELPFATAEDCPEIAGSYSGLTARTVFLPSEYLLGLQRWDERIDILGCDCGEVGCWPLRMRVTLHDDRVVWDSFIQPHRAVATDTTPAWDYSTFGPFVFEKQAYLAALAAVV